jgi:outer membrane lipoprotein carrier protein
MDRRASFGAFGLVISVLVLGLASGQRPLLAGAWPIQGQATKPAPAPADLARALQARYAGINDFRADFTQSIQGGVLRTVTTQQRGEVSIKKPGRMRWTYKAPHHQVMVADGTRIYLYNASDRTGMTSPMPTGDDLSAAVLFLTGRGDLLRDFTASMPAVQPDGEWHLALTPRVVQDDFASLTLAVDRTTLAFRGFAWTDHQGGANTIRFTNLRENVGITEKEFVYAFPKGTTLISSGGGN